MQERFDKYAADYAGFAAEGRPAEGMMWSVTALSMETRCLLGIEHRQPREIE